MMYPVPDPPLRVRILTVVKDRGPLTFPQIVHAVHANRGTVWRLLKALERDGRVNALVLHGRTHYEVQSG